MNQKLILGGMNQKLIDVEKGRMFYCNNCNNEFDHIISFLPIQGLNEYYTCKFCNSIMPVKDLKIKNLNCSNYNDICTFCCFF